MKVIHNSRFTIDESIYTQEDNVFAFDKPYQCTSFDLVAKVKYAMKRKFGKKVKVGHAGTLDPLASGLMIVCTGKFTKQIESFQAEEKEYTGTIRLGATTPSFDKEKPVDATYPTEHITEEMVRRAAREMTGEQEQVPPQFSAVRIAGKRAFSYAREGADVEIQPRRITISEFEITRCELPDVDFRIVCSKGTYIRSIARDFGLALESGAHLTALRRTRIGQYKVEDAIQCHPISEEEMLEPKENSTLILGLMSGTSLDGLDLALCHFYTANSQWKYDILKAATAPYNDKLRQELSAAPQLSGLELAKLDREFAKAMAEEVKKFLKDSPHQPQYIASHGQTIFHQPEIGLTLQIGSGAVLAAETGIPVICDFRTTDVALGGQGAPIVPIGDELLYNQYDSCLNLGGFCNISFKKSGKRVAFDIAPCNLLLNFLARREGSPFDPNGKMAREGAIIHPLLEKLNEIPFYQKEGAKSLGKEWLDREILPLFDVNNVKIKDLLRTATEHISTQIAKILINNHIPTLLATGGGAKNSFLVERLQALAPKTRVTIPDENTINFKEAIIFAFLGLLRIQGKANCLHDVTGSLKDNCGGAVYLV